MPSCEAENYGKRRCQGETTDLKYKKVSFDLIKVEFCKKKNCKHEPEESQTVTDAPDVNNISVVSTIPNQSINHTLSINHTI